MDKVKRVRRKTYVKKKERKGKEKKREKRREEERTKRTLLYLLPRSVSRIETFSSILRAKFYNITEN